MSSASFLARLLASFERAFDDFGTEIGTHGAPVTVLSELGWSIPAGTDLVPVGAAFGSLATALQDLATTAHTLSQLPEDADLEDLMPAIADVTADIAAMVNAARALSQLQPGALPPPFSDPALWQSLAEDAVDVLLVRYLDGHQRVVSGFLRVLGVIVEGPEQPAAGARDAYVVTTIDWGALGSVFSKPDHLMADVYGWGGAFKPDPLLRNLVGLFGGLGLFPARLQPPKSVLDLYYSPGNPARATATQLSVPLYWERSTIDPSSEVLAVDLELALLPIPPAGNPGGAPEGLVLYPDLELTAAVTFPLSPIVDLTVEGDLNAALFRVDIHPSGASIAIDPPALQFSGSFGIDASPEEPWILVGTKGSTRIELDGAHAKVGVAGSGTDLEASVEAALKGARVVIEFGEGDGFLTKVLGEDPQQAEFSLAALWSSKKGFRIEGQVEIDITLALHLSIADVFSIDSLYIALGAGSSGRAHDRRRWPVAWRSVRCRRASSAWVSPTWRPRASTASSPAISVRVDLGFGFKLPDGVGMEIDASVVVGGGYVEHKDDEYDGILEVCVADYIQIKVIGLLNTKLPDGRPGFSLLLIITAEFQPIQLGYGFTLNGVGGLAGINRTMVTEAIRSGIRNGTVRSIMFPPDPIKNAPQLISNLRAIFPVAEGDTCSGRW